MITQRQEKILNTLVREYIERAEPISSSILKERCDLDICPATVRNDLQQLTELGFIEQPHTSAGRIPTKKAYRYFVNKIFSEHEEILSSFILKEIETARKRIEDELRLAEELTRSLENMSSALDFTYMPEKDILFEALTILGPSRLTHDKSINLINSLLKELENF